MRRDLVAVGLLWAAGAGLFALGAARLDFFPFAASREAAVADAAFRLLLYMAAPVFAFVAVVLVYSFLRFRGRGDPPADAPPLREHPAVARAWLAVTAALAAYVMYNPGLVGIGEMRGEHRADLAVRVEAARWSWKFIYPNGVASRVLVLPAGRRIRFEVISLDVLHAFWVPAFRTKVDAVPGLVTMLHVTPTVTGTERDSHTLRVRCAELCGLGHDVMHVPVRIVAQGAFDRWLAEQQPQARGR